MAQNNRKQEEWIKEPEAEVVHHIRVSPGEEELQGSGVLNPMTEEPSSAFLTFPHSNFFVCNNSLCQAWWLTPTTLARGRRRQESVWTSITTISWSVWTTEWDWFKHKQAQTRNETRTYAVLRAENGSADTSSTELSHYPTASLYLFQ